MCVRAGGGVGAGGAPHIRGRLSAPALITITGAGSPSFRFPRKTRIRAVFGKSVDHQVKQKPKQQPLTRCGSKLHGPKPKAQGAPLASAAGGGAHRRWPCTPQNASGSQNERSEDAETDPEDPGLSEDAGHNRGDAVGIRLRAASRTGTSKDRAGCWLLRPGSGRTGS